MGNHDGETDMGHRPDATDPRVLRTVMSHIRWGWAGLTFLVNLVGFAIVGSWLLATYTTSFEARVRATEKAVEELGQMVGTLAERVAAVEGRQSSLDTSVAVLETRSESQSESLQRIENGVQDLAREVRASERNRGDKP